MCVNTKVAGARQKEKKREKEKEREKLQNCFHCVSVMLEDSKRNLA